MITKKLTSSPFKLRRSIVPQSEGGAYETGGYDPDSYDASSQIYASSIEGGAKIFSAALGSLSSSDFNKLDVANNERRKNRVNRIDKKIKNQTKTKEEIVNSSSNETPDYNSVVSNSVSDKGKKLKERKAKIEGRIKKTDERIKKYESTYGNNFTSNDFLNNQRKQ